MGIEFDRLTLMRAAAEEGVDVRSLSKRLRGEEVRGLAGARCDRAIAKLRAQHEQPRKAA